MLPFQQQRIDPAIRSRWLDETYRSALDQRFDARVGVELQRVSVDVDVAIARVDAELGVGRITDAGFEGFCRRFDQRELDRCVVGLRRIGVDRRLRAREVPGAVQPPQILVERRGGIRIPGFDRAVVAHSASL